MLPLRATGQTLILRYPRADDAGALFALGRDRQTTRFLSWGPYRHPDEPAAYIARLAGQRRRGEQLDFLIEHREHGPIGVTGFSEVSRRDRRAVIGSWLGRPFWGTGANTEAKALMARIGFQALGLARIGAYANPDNARSVRALTRLGWTPEGTLRAFHRHGEEVHDVHVLSLLREEWEGSALAAVPGRLAGVPPAAFR